MVPLLVMPPVILPLPLVTPALPLVIKPVLVTLTLSPVPKINGPVKGLFMALIKKSVARAPVGAANITTATSAVVFLNVRLHFWAPNMGNYHLCIFGKKAPRNPRQILTILTRRLYLYDNI